MGQFTQKTRLVDREGSALIPYHENDPFTEAMLDRAEKPSKNSAVKKQQKGSKTKMAKRETYVEKRGTGKDAVHVVFDAQSGKPVRTLLNPAQRRKRYCRQLQSKKDHRGNDLSNTQLAWRSGYMAANKEQTKIFKKKNPGYKRKEN